MTIVLGENDDSLASRNSATGITLVDCTVEEPSFQRSQARRPSSFVRILHEKVDQFCGTTCVDATLLQSFLHLRLQIAVRRTDQSTLHRKINMRSRFFARDGDAYPVSDLGQSEMVSPFCDVLGTNSWLSSAIPFAFFQLFHFALQVRNFRRHIVNQHEGLVEFLSKYGHAVVLPFSGFLIVGPATLIAHNLQETIYTAKFLLSPHGCFSLRKLQNEEM